MTSHLDDGIIQELLDGEVPSAALPPMQAHLAACAECRARLELGRAMMAEADELIELLDEPTAPGQSASVVLPRRRSAGRPWLRQLAWAASVVVAVGAGWYARGDVERVLPAPIAVPGPATEAVVSNTTPSEVSPATPSRTTSAPAAVAAQDKPTATDIAAKTSGLAAAELRAEAAQVLAAAPPARADSTTSRLVPPAAMGGGFPVTGAMRERGARTDVMAGDQVATKQLAGGVVMSDTLAIRMVAMQSVLESLFGSLHTAAGEEVTLICVAFTTMERVGMAPVDIRGEDPPIGVLALLPKAPRPFRPGSACTTASVAPTPVIEAATGRPALALLVGDVRIRAGDKATVGVQWRQHARSGAGTRCEVARRGDAWVVTACRGTWVS